MGLWFNSNRLGLVPLHIKHPLFKKKLKRLFKCIFNVYMACVVINTGNLLNFHFYNLLHCLNNSSKVAEIAIYSAILICVISFWRHDDALGALRHVLSFRAHRTLAVFCYKLSLYISHIIPLFTFLITFLGCSLSIM